MEGAKLQELCSKMYEQGFTYASFQDIKDGDILLERPVGESPKPTKGLYFSKLKLYNKDLGLSNSSDRKKSHESKSFVYPEWYNFVKREGFNVRDYEKKGIIFAKIDENKLKKIKDLKAVKVTNHMFKFVPEYDWAKITDCGVNVNDNEIIHDNGWDIEQCIIWNNDCIKEYKIFKNTGNRITYKEANCEIKNMDVNEQLKKTIDDFGKMIASFKLF